MFKLKNTLNGRIATPDIVVIPTGALGAETTFYAGDALCYASGAIAKCNGDKTAEFVVVDKAVIGTAGGELKCVRVEKALVFEAELSAYSSTYTVLGGHVTFASTGDKITATAASTNYGAMIIDTCGASASGDKVLCVLA